MSDNIYYYYKFVINIYNFNYYVIFLYIFINNYLYYDYTNFNNNKILLL